MTARSLRWGLLAAAALTAFIGAAAMAAYSSAAPSPQLGSLSTVNLCVRRAGPEKGAVRFVERRRYCKANELGVRVLGEGSTQAALGLTGAGASAAPVARPVSSTEIRYVRIEAVSTIADGTPEAANATADCPPGAQVVGGGYRVDGGDPSATSNPGEVAVTETRPVSAASWTVTAFADDAGEVGPWSVAAYAVCADTVAP